MIKNLFKVVKKVIIAIILLYSLNLLTSAVNVVIPINIITIAIVALLGIPGLGTVTILYLLI